MKDSTELTHNGKTIFITEKVCLRVTHRKTKFLSDSCSFKIDFFLFGYFCFYMRNKDS